MPVKYFDDVKTGEISSRLVNDTSQVKDLLASTLPNAMTSLLQFVGALVIMLAMDWRMTLLMFVAVPLVILVMLPVMNQSRKIGRVRQDELAKFASDSTDVLGEVRLVKSSNGEEHDDNVSWDSWLRSNSCYEWCIDNGRLSFVFNVSFPDY